MKNLWITLSFFILGAFTCVASNNPVLEDFNTVNLENFFEADEGCACNLEADKSVVSESFNTPKYGKCAGKRQVKKSYSSGRNQRITIYHQVFYTYKWIPSRRQYAVTKSIKMIKRLQIINRYRPDTFKTLSTKTISSKKYLSVKKPCR